MTGALSPCGRAAGGGGRCVCADPPLKGGEHIATLGGDFPPHHSL